MGVGQGGAITIRLEGAAGNMSFDDIFLDSDGSIFQDVEGGIPEFEGDGGLGQGGNITFDLLGGTFTATDINIGSDGFGGDGGSVADTDSGTWIRLDISKPVKRITAHSG